MEKPSFAFSIPTNMNICVKNTFLDVSFVEGHGAAAIERCRSCPSIACEHDTDNSKDVKTLVETGHAKDTRELAMIASPSGYGPAVSLTNDDLRMKYKSGRPCKGKRLRHRKFVDQLEAESLTRVNRFKMEDVEWLPSLEGNNRRKQHVLRIVEQYRNGQLARKHIANVRVTHGFQ